jgi:hypothetical protein
VRRTGGATFDRTEEVTYFLAADPKSLNEASAHYGHLLIAVDQLRSDKDLAIVEGWCERGVKVLIDSGVFALANKHATTHDIPLSEALKLHPSRLDGFDWLWKRYLEVVERVGERSWGYVELDIGGPVVKAELRTELESRGLRPIPVYHPLSDGWDHFDVLAKQYDRMCWGNVVHADAGERLRWFSTAWERRRQYPYLWLHLLGVTPAPVVNAFPPSSCDSSSWLNAVRWPGFEERAALLTIGDLGGNFKPAPTLVEGSRRKGVMCAATMYDGLLRNWRQMNAAVR